MKKVFSLFVLNLLCTCIINGQQVRADVFVSGQEGHKSYRIPAIIKTPDGDLLAFAEGRVNHAGDFGDVNIVMKRSSDNGKTWSRLFTLVDYDSLQAGNHAPVVDLTDPAYPKGRIFLFYNTGNNHEGEVRKGNGLREVWYITSVDNGETWSAPVNITMQTHRPLQPGLNPSYNFKEDWRCYANTPGHAFQFGTGKYKGRMYVAANHSYGNPQKEAMDYVAHGFYTDDHGKTFHISETVAVPGSNESTAAALANGRLIMNSRNQRGNVKARIVSYSSDGGQTWDTSYYDKNLPDPVNEGSILNLGKVKKKTRLAFCNAADTQKRDNLTLRISKDGGKTWKKSIVVDVNGKANNAAYSDLVELNNNTIGVLYEKESYSRIVFTAVKWK